MRKAFAMVLSSHTTSPSDLQPELVCPGTTRRSHTHGINRNRIVLHVALSGRRKFTR